MNNLQSINMKTGIEQITDERATHEGKGYTASHDDGHDDQILTAVALSLLADLPDCWGIAEKARNKGGRIRQLVVAGSLIAAEIDRLKRLHRLPTDGKMVTNGNAF